MKKIILIDKIFLLTLIPVIFINVYFYLVHFNEYIKFLEIYISIDGNISEPKLAFLRILLFLISLLLIVLFRIYENLNLNKKKFSIINHFKSLKKYEKIAFIFIFILFIPSVLQLIDDNGLKYGPISVFKIIYKEDGFLEYLTALFGLIASIILLISVVIKKGKYEIFFKIFLSLFFFIFAMEEISWGQRIIGWETPTGLMERNYQNETNIHNFFNPYFQIVYPCFNLIIALFIYLSINYREFIIKFFKSEKYIYLLPNKSHSLFVYIFLILSIQCQIYTGEVTEEVFSIFILIYSINQLSISKYNNKKFINK